MGDNKKHAPTRDKKTKEGLRTTNADGGGQKHTHSTDEETKGV